MGHHLYMVSFDRPTASATVDQGGKSGDDHYALSATVQRKSLVKIDVGDAG
jgi:hypothetical protein